jgi:hypothetical protein
MPRYFVATAHPGRAQHISHPSFRGASKASEPLCMLAASCPNGALAIGNFLQNLCNRLKMAIAACEIGDRQHRTYDLNGDHQAFDAPSLVEHYLISPDDASGEESLRRCRLVDGRRSGTKRAAISFRDPERAGGLVR